MNPKHPPMYYRIRVCEKLNISFVNSQPMELHAMNDTITVKFDDNLSNFILEQSTINELQKEFGMNVVFEAKANEWNDVF